MNVVLAGTPAEVSKSFDEAGLAVAVQSVRWGVVDERGAALLAMTPLDGFENGATEVALTVPASANALSAGVPRALRVVRLECTLEGGAVVTLESGYVVQAQQPLLVGVNSFQTHTHAQMTALDIPGLAAWDGATEAQRVQALAAAFERIRQYRYWVEVGPAQDRLADTFCGMLDELTVSEYEALPEVFKKALRLAQVAEADAILAGPGEEEVKRDAGVVVDAIDEVRREYRQGVRLKTFVSRQALRYIGRYIDHSMRLVR